MISQTQIAKLYQTELAQICATVIFHYGMLDLA